MKVVVLLTLMFYWITGHTRPIPPSEFHLQPFVENINKVFHHLPGWADISDRVWDANDWELKKGGTAKIVEGDLSPLEKLEAISHQSLGAQRWELNHIDANRDVDWAGHCNGQAMASIIFNKPSKGATYDGVYFSPLDIEALMVELLQGPAEYILGGHCQSYRFHYGDKDLFRACQDINPATFHILLGNMLGLNKQSFIIDIARGSKVYNYPIKKYAFKYKYLKYRKAAPLANKHGRSTMLDHSAPLYVEVNNSVTLRKDVVKNYHYLLELDAHNQIVGGVWLGKSTLDHPEFIWPAKTKGLENPFINKSELQYLLERLLN